MAEHEPQSHEVVIVGGGLAGLSAAIYLGRARRDTLLIDAGHSMAVWEPEVQNYLGFPEGISGEGLLERGRAQARQFDIRCEQDEVLSIERDKSDFLVHGRGNDYSARRLLLATGIYHIPPDIPGVSECLGHSLFFCKDCDGYRVQGKRIVIIGSNNEAVEYALGMLLYASNVMIATNQSEGFWDEQHAAWLAEYAIPVQGGRIVEVMHQAREIEGLCFEGGRKVAADVLFATRGDLVHNGLARSLGAALDSEGQIVVDAHQQTTVPGLYAAGCVTPANCQMIIAAGQGATAAQAINRDLFEESLRTHALRRFRSLQLKRDETLPRILE